METYCTSGVSVHGHCCRFCFTGLFFLVSVEGVCSWCLCREECSTLPDEQKSKLRIKLYFIYYYYYNLNISLFFLCLSLIVI